jgi:hypothetical protein
MSLFTKNNKINQTNIFDFIVELPEVNSKTTWYIPDEDFTWWLGATVLVEDVYPNKNEVKCSFSHTGSNSTLKGLATIPASLFYELKDMGDKVENHLFHELRSRSIYFNYVRFTKGQK